MQKNKRRNLMIIIMTAALLIGIGIMFYPLLAYHYAERTRSRIQTYYEEAVDQSGEDMLDAIRTEAQRYNEKLYKKELNVLTPVENGYFKQMVVNGLDTIAYVRIPKIKIELPIYHGIDNDALSRGCGHMPQSSLPIGGENTHCVLSAHSGMAESPMFSDLGKLEIGDVFYIKALGEVLTYEVCDINVVIPEDIDLIQPERGQDLCTLVTCVPYNINTHRLLVKGTRVETQQVLPEDINSDNEEIMEESIWLDSYIQSVLSSLAIGAASIAFLAVLLVFRYKKMSGKIDETIAEKYAGAKRKNDSVGKSKDVFKAETQKEKEGKEL